MFWWGYLQVAIKRIPDVFKVECETRRFVREIHILRRLKHPNIIKLVDVFVNGGADSFDELYLVFEVCVCVLGGDREPRRVLCARKIAAVVVGGVTAAALHRAVSLRSTWTQTCRSCSTPRLSWKM
jgi:hypothetical protein